MAENPSYQIAEDAAEHLRKLVGASATALERPIAGTERLIADLYTGRDAGNRHDLATVTNGTLTERYPLRAVDGNWTAPETSVNLMLSRLQQIVSNLVPAKPTFHVKPRVAGAARLSEAQNKISQFLTDHGRLRDAMKRAAFIGMMSPYFGMKFTVKPKKEARGDWDRVEYCALEARECGYEPFQRRFKWHTYGKQWGDLPQTWRRRFEAATNARWEMNDWDVVKVTEVYHDGFRFGHKEARDRKMCPMSVFIHPDKKDEDATKSFEFTRDDGDRYPGTYIITENVRECPLVVAAFNEAAPNEDVPPAEVATWVPHIRKIAQTIVQINREVRNLQSIYLYDKEAIKDKVLDSIIQDGIPSETVFVGVDTQMAGERGVNATLRPVEQADNLGSLLAVLQNDLALFDDVIGLGPMERGLATNPRKSATEAQSISSNASRRNRSRLDVIARAMSDLLQSQFYYQRDIFGKSLDIPRSKDGIAERLDVPDPSAAQFAFEVDPVELGHLSKQGDADALFNALTVVSNTLATFQGAIPKPVRELLRRVLVAQGMPDADLLIDLPTLEAGPVDRLIEHLMSGDPLQVKADDQHQAYIAYYEGILPKLVDSQPDAADAVSQAIMEHNVHIRRAAAANINAAAQPNVVPGVTQNGPDNAIQSALLAGEPPPFPQSQGF